MFKVRWENLTGEGYAASAARQNQEKVHAALLKQMKRDGFQNVGTDVAGFELWEKAPKETRKRKAHVCPACGYIQAA